MLCWRRWMLVAALLLLPAMAQEAEPSARRELKVCQSVDVRNDESAFERLRGCGVVEGFVQILLMDRTDEASLENVTFPELREITDYLLLYRVNGLRSLGRLFPNLAVVRGRTLFFNYALVVFEMMHLQEIGLQSLTDVLRGSVRIEKNPLLCYVDTIDWDVIARSGKGEHFIKANRQQNECPMCPSQEKLRCPLMPVSKEALCWNRHKCQKVCPESCGGRTCSSKGECCHENCLGGCTGPSAKDCFSCKDMFFQGHCVKRCPATTFKFMSRRCIQEEECVDMPVPKELTSDYLSSKPWKPFNGSCILDCPPDYMESQHDNHCKPCDGPCRKECTGVSVDSIASAQKLRGCTYIKGSLEIQIRGGRNIVKELEESLSMIEEIDGYLKIVRSFPLVSLNFLRNLKVIHGNELDTEKYSLVVLDNQNLQELWDWNTRPEDLQIKRGRFFFHFNPKLCLNKIEKLKNVTNVPEMSELDVARNSNGDKVACNIQTLHVNVTLRKPFAVVISWQQFQHYDPRSLLNYVVYSIEAPYQNVTLYDGRDACGTDGWKVDDVAISKDEYVFYALTLLKPYTQYAFYVKTYTIATERLGAQSPIYYVRTLPGTPTAPQLLQAISNSSSTVVVQWQPPASPKGNITHYIVSGYWVVDNANILDERNYCFDSITPLEQKPQIIATDRSTPKPSDDTCSCEKEEDVVEGPQVVESEVQFQIDFEDTLHNMVYVKRPNNRSKREVDGGYFSMFNDDKGRKSAVEDFGKKKYGNNVTGGVYHSFSKEVYDSNIVVLNNLSHYAQYNIEVQACRERIPEDEPNATICSEPSYVTVRTLKLAHADNIDSKFMVVEVTNQSRVKLKWEEPRRPNGLIVAYQIEYRLVDIENYKPTPECVQSTTYRKDGFYILRRLLPGNYSVQVRANSLAGYGDYTPKRYFYIKDTAASGLDLLIGALVGTVLVMLLIFAGAFFLRRKYVPGVPNMRLIASVNPEYVSTVYVPDEWELPRKKVELLRELGQGSFGMVYEGIGHGIADQDPQIRCAIKTVNENASDRERSEFLNEASVMKAFNTHHVVKLLGVVSQGQPVLVVMELMAYGDLKTYLRSHRPDSGDTAPSMQPPTLKRILQMAIEIADGMTYLTAKKFVHRDLAARNCMVAEDLTVKIGDFGMTRDIYETDYYRKGTKGLLPVRWMAPESLKDGVFTSYSDVWSYGVVLWEMATLASQPYQGLSNDQVLRYVIDGGVMERPENCPDRLYELMRMCWQQKPLSRPQFMELVEHLLSDVPAKFREVSYYHSAEAEETRAQQLSAMLAVSNDPSTPLRITRDIEDFSLGDSDVDEADLEEAPEDAAFPPNSQHNPHYQSVSPSRPAPPAVSNHGSQASKVGNGSTVTTPTTANGWIGNHQSNGTGNLTKTNVAMKTTEC